MSRENQPFIWRNWPVRQGIKTALWSAPAFVVEDWLAEKFEDGTGLETEWYVDLIGTLIISGIMRYAMTSRDRLVKYLAWEEGKRSKGPFNPYDDLGD